MNADETSDDQAWTSPEPYLKTSERYLHDAEKRKHRLKEQFVLELAFKKMALHLVPQKYN